MAKKTSTEKKSFPVIPVIIAIIGCCGTIIAAAITGYFGYLSTRTQIDLPVKMTQTAVSEPPASEEAVTSSYDWEDLIDIQKQTPCPAYFIPEYTFSDSDPVKWFQEHGNSISDQLYSDDFMFAPIVGSKGTRLFINLLISNISNGQDWVMLSKDATLSIRYAGEAPETSHVLYIEACGGGGYIREFSEVDLQTNYDKYDAKASSSDADFYTLEPGEFELFEFNFKCQDPGIYQVEVNIPMQYQGEEGLITYSGVSGFVCPQKMNVYLGGATFPDDPGIPIYDVKVYEWDGANYREK